MNTTRRSAAVLLALALAAPLQAGGGDQEVFEKAYSMEGIEKISVSCAIREISPRRTWKGPWIQPIPLAWTRRKSALNSKAVFSDRIETNSSDT